ncbi:DUF2207 domain-containing protein [Stenotrophomonas maltophilia]|nr:DUF2207 domain-containing protein [Stenotrophomonas maltophilia]MCU1115885.1 hypothetical protein [Stenotrophomonas maltophilia]TQM07971.1 hypothetical protein FB552_1047 [Stenotrophomonas maltophilia]
MTQKHSRAALSRGSSERAQRLLNLRASLDGLGIGAGFASVVGAILLSDALGLPRTLMISASAIIAGLCTADIVSLYLRGKITLGSTATVTITPMRANSLTEEEITDLRNVLSDLGSRFRESAQDDSSGADRLLRHSRAVIDEARKRLLENASQINKRSQVSLVTGSGIAVGAVLILLAFAFPPIPMYSLRWEQVLWAYLPKLGVIVMLEVFAFFFLRLYRASLVESRAVHADLNALALKEAALVAAWAESDQQRLQLATTVIEPAPEGYRPADDSSHGLDPKLVADLMASISKLVRG